MFGPEHYADAGPNAYVSHPSVYVVGYNIGIFVSRVSDDPRSGPLSSCSVIPFEELVPQTRLVYVAVRLGRVVDLSRHRTPGI